MKTILQLKLQTKFKMRKRKKTYRILIVVFMVVGFSACMVGPNYQRPEIETPEKYLYSNKNDTIHDLIWKDILKDPILIDLIDSALANNFDAQIAASRIMEARYYLGYTKADQYPSISYGGSAGYGNSLGAFPTGTDATGNFNITGNFNWELVFWGKYRRATEAARAELLASEYGLKAIEVSLVADVAKTYYLLLDYKSRLEISINTLDSRKESSRIINERFNMGIIPEIDLNQAQIQEDIAAASIPVYERLIAFTENALSILIGKSPQRIMTDASIENVIIPDSIPAGLPSQLLIRRPDILQAEQMLIAQNARIGVAQAMRFPSISLTAAFGMASPDLSAFNAGDALIGTVGAGLFGPIFNFGKNKRRVDIEKERTEQMRLNYEKAVISAFRETEDALININTIEQELVFVESQVKSSTNAAMLSKERYDGGVTSYLEVLETERALFNIELYFSELRQRRLSAYSDLFKILGGGWSINN
jgi:multidrug efflux system outer membrane protein